MPTKDMTDRVQEAAKLLRAPEAQCWALAATYDEAKEWGTPEDRAQAARHILWTKGDRRGYEPGGFTQTLILAWRRADPQNRARLILAFPIYGVAFDVEYEEGNDGLARWGGI